MHHEEKDPLEAGKKGGVPGKRERPTEGEGSRGGIESACVCRNEGKRPVLVRARTGPKGNPKTRVPSSHWKKGGEKKARSIMPRSGEKRPPVP